MLNKILNILKIRWQEAVMLMGLCAGLVVLRITIMEILLTEVETKAHLPYGIMFLLGLGGMTLAIVVMTQLFGFLKSITTDPVVPLLPMELLKQGRALFWRLLFFVFFMEVALGLLGEVIAISFAWFFFRITSPELVPDWLRTTGLFISLVVFLKPLLFVPAIVIVKDCTVSESLPVIRQLALLRMPILRKLFGSGIAVLGIIILVTELIPIAEKIDWIFSVFQGTMAISIFMIFLMAAILKISELSQVPGSSE